MFVRIINSFAFVFFSIACSPAFSAESSLFYKLTFENKNEAWVFASSHSAYHHDKQIQRALDIVLGKSTQIGIENYFGLSHPEKVEYLRANYNGPKLQELTRSAQECFSQFQTSQQAKFFSQMDFKLPPPAFSLYVGGLLIPKASNVQRPSFEYGWDIYIINYAIAKFHALEEIEASIGQLRFYNSLDNAEISQMMVGICKLAQSEEALKAKELLMRGEQQAYQDRDLEQLFVLAKHKYVAYAGWNDSSVYKFSEGRNTYFARRIVELNRTKKVNFFAIGAAHFGGDGSVLRQLEKLGVNVMPVSLDEIARK